MGKKEIAGVKKELQDFATKTIYSSSEMATFLDSVLSDANISEKFYL